MSKIHLFRIDWLKHTRNGKVIREEKNLNNTLHKRGEEFMLRALFTAGNSPNSLIPDDYYFGLDNRTTVNDDDDFVNVVGEPTSYGYSRQTVSSLGEITVSENDNKIRGTTTILTFRADGGTWGPVRNLFITDRSDNNGYLIATVANASAFTVIDGDDITMRMSIGLSGC